MKFVYFFEFVLSKILNRMRPRGIKNSFIHKKSSIGPGSQFVNSEMKKHSYCGANCQILDTTIGSFTSIANNCVIGTDTHSIEWGSTSPVFNKNREQIKFKFSMHTFDTREKVSVGHDVWIGERAIILSGITVGDGAVIGAGSIVTKDIPPYEIWAGVPAKFLRHRFSDPLKAKYISSQWWLKTEKEIASAAQFVQDPATFIKILG